jgi:hypothetical protein
VGHAAKDKRKPQNKAVAQKKTSECREKIMEPKGVSYASSPRVTDQPNV